MADEKPRAAAGWYLHPQERHSLRFWDGTAWTADRAPAPGAGVAPEPSKRSLASPRDMLAFGLGMSVIGGVLAGAIASSNPSAAYFAIAATYLVGGIPLTIGIIAKGVQIGRRG